jgi:hypothetical protein
VERSSMTEAKKFDGGKPRLDLVPWPDLHVMDDISIPVETMYETLKLWFFGSPFRLTMPIPRGEIVGVAQVLAMGAVKYGDRNWELGLPFSRIFAAAGRHAEAWARGEILDPESGLSHSSHFWCNVIFLVTFTMRNRADLDDRPPAHAAVREQLDRMTSFVAQTSDSGIMSPGPNPKAPNGVN